MAWSYTAERRNTGWADSSRQVYWENGWTVTEVTPTQAGKMRLRVDFTTYSSWAYPENYIEYSTDKLVFNGTEILIQDRTRVGYTYTKYIQVPNSWSGQNVNFLIGLRSVWTTLGATPNAPSTVSASNGTFGSAIPITITKAVSGALTHTVTVSCAGRTETLQTQGSALNLSWVPDTATYAALITSANSAAATITCTTYYGSTSMGTSTKSITVSFAANSLAPVVSSGWAAASYYNTGTAAASITEYVQGYSKAQVTFDASKISCQYGATISGYSISCEGVTDSASPYRTGTLAGTSASIVCTVTDSRGQSAAETLSVSLRPYAKPTLTQLAILRSDSSGTEDEDGAYITARAAANFSPLNGQNSYAMKLYIKPVSGSWAERGSMTSGAALTVGTYSADTTYDVRIVLTDALANTAQYEQRLPARAWAMKFRPDGNGVAFGKAAEHDKALEIPADWEIYRGTGPIVFPVAQGGTGATTAEAAKVNLGLGSLELRSFNIAANASRDITIPASTHGFIVTAGGGYNNKGIWVYNSTTSGAITLSAIGTAPSSVTIATATSEITITNNTTVYLYVAVFSY